MKKVKIALLALIATVLILPACKKGPDDPFLSLRSRKARLTGVWTLGSGTTTTTDATGTTTDTYTSSMATETSGGTTTMYPYTETLTFVKDGTYEIKTSTTYSFGGTSTTATDDVKGYWYFGRKNKSEGIKNKEEVVLVCTSDESTDGSSVSISSYTGASCPTSTYLLDELKNSEIIVTLTGTSLSGSTLSQITGSKTYNQ